MENIIINKQDIDVLFNALRSIYKNYNLLADQNFIVKDIILSDRIQKAIDIIDNSFITIELIARTHCLGKYNKEESL